MLEDKQLLEMVQYFKDLVGEKYVSTSIFERIKSAIDPFPYKAERDSLPYVVVLPENKEQISEIMKYANKNKIPVFVRGSGTQLAGSSRPHVSGIMLITRRMTKTKIYKEYGYFECEVGIRIAEMSEILEKEGYYLPIWNGSKRFASIGGVVSNNTSGHITDAAIGKPGDFILGLEAVLPTGEIIETGTKGNRRPAGTDLGKLFVGGYGLLGIITKVRIRLVPKLKEAYGFAIFPDVESLGRGVQRIFWENRPLPLLMEFVSKDTAEAGYTIKGLTPPPGPILLMLATGLTQEEADYKIKELMKSFHNENPIDAYQVADMDEWRKLMSIREDAGPFTMQKLKQQSIACEVVASLPYLIDALKDVENFEEGIPVLQECKKILFGHIGGLTMHPTFIIPPEWSEEKLKKAAYEIFRKEGELNVK